MKKIITIAIIIASMAIYWIAAYAEIDGTDLARRNSYKTFTQFSPPDTTEVISMFMGYEKISYQFTLASVTDTVKVVPQVSADGVSWMDAYIDTLTYTANGTSGVIIQNIPATPYSRIICHGDTGATIDMIARPGNNEWR